MEDVIFNGTQTRRARLFCEVTLTFDNSDRKLPIDFIEGLQLPVVFSARVRANIVLTAPPAA